MDWLQEAMSFPECNSTRVRDFAPEQEMKRAIGQYNRAVRNLRADSMDIALIALRSLASTYPMFAQAVLLYGCCQMAVGNLRTGTEVFAQARTELFTERFRARTEEYREAAQADLEQRAADPQQTAAPEAAYRIHPGAPLIQRGSFSRPSLWARLARWGARLRARLRYGAGGAGETSGSPRVREPLTMRFAFLTDWRRLLLAAAALAAVGLILFGAVRLVSGWFGKEKPAPPVTDSERLSWLVAALTHDAALDPQQARSPQALLDAYAHAFPDPGGQAGVSPPAPTAGASPTPLATTQPAPTVTPTSAPAAPTPTATPIPPTVPDHTETLRLAAAMLEDARARIGNQPVEAYRLLRALDDTLAGLPADTRAEGIDSSAGEMLSARTALIDGNEWHLCEAHRVAAEAPWQARDYATCLPLYEAVYQINPVYYTGYCAYRLGLCYEQVGAFAQALACYRTVESIGPASPQYAGARARIAALG